ncbi:NAD-dependent epimerase/dehydratase family protein [Nitrosopumilus sp.]|uniref:NAD-dependent epimerase/dehydratase family protein n=1 Tax=Nitrosopumilus sp. TaxID=2024843 RepID=UPI003D14ADCC
MLFTILGSSGFIGKNLVNHLRQLGIEVKTPDIRHEILEKTDLGHVIYAIGEIKHKEKTQDFINSHVGYLTQILDDANFDSFLYCSATRVYSQSMTTNEDSLLCTNSFNPNNLYTNSKILGESICLSYNNPKIKIARLSNVTGNNPNSDLFLPSLIRDAVDKKHIELFTTLQSEKDYVLINDVTKILPKILLDGKFRIYNVASGINITNEKLISKIQEITKCDFSISEHAFDYSFPKIDISRIKNEFDFYPQPILDTLEDIINSYKNQNF